MKQASKRTLQALSSLQGNHDFEVIMDWIKETRNELIERLPHAEGEQTAKAQGQLLDLNEIINTANKATDILYQATHGNT